ncbi:hypothetical protein [Bradyrhizobium sp. Ash2021]|uniref:HoxN/HupN/NixA family nickel/cobalt transporter n=1 Tax=Bradyrhizobium sp. Ash2021 TaxID=2954771 RepID=UPI0028158A16|nr:hypothetical protein [Bradyrhizobium sp. Ash2021]WMT72086.1 hypothetical protein NL528_29035 [Bradyrhizobium sp. Ash2021]
MPPSSKRSRKLQSGIPDALALFTASMALIDAADGALMVGAYSWSFVNPIRMLWNHFVITAVSVVVALFIGRIEAVAVIRENSG